MQQYSVRTLRSECPYGHFRHYARSSHLAEEQRGSPRKRGRIAGTRFEEVSCRGKYNGENVFCFPYASPPPMPSSPITPFIFSAATICAFLSARLSASKTAPAMSLRGTSSGISIERT